MTERRRGKRMSGRPCHYCGRIMIESKERMSMEERSISATVDHVIPRDMGGNNNPYNLVISCARCNNLRATVPYEVFMEFARVVIREFPNATTTVLRRSLNLYIMYLLESVTDKKKEVNRALSLSLLRMKDELSIQQHVI